MNKIVSFFLLPFFCISFSFMLKAMPPGIEGGGIESDRDRGSQGPRGNVRDQIEANKEARARTNYSNDNGAPSSLSPAGGFPIQSAPPSAERTEDSSAQENLEKAQKAVKEALEHCNAASIGFSSDLKPVQDALKNLFEAQQTAINAYNSEGSNIDEKSLETSDILESLKAVKKICGIACSNEELPSQQDNEDGQLPLLTIQKSKQQLEECEKIRDKILSTVVLFNHNDPLHPAKWTASDAAIFPIILPLAYPTAFGISDPTKAGIGANVVGTLTASPWLFDRVSRAASRMLPGGSYEGRRQALERGSVFFRNYIADSDYLGYYLTGWAFLKIVKQDPEFLKSFIPFNCEVATVARKGTLLSGFIVSSALARKGISRLIQSEYYQRSLLKEAQELTADHPGWSFCLARASRIPWNVSTQALLGVLERFGPDIAAATTRSFMSNLYDYSQGKITPEEVINKTVYSAAVYTAATMGFYTLYRLLEVAMWRAQPTRSSYQSFAATDRKAVEKLKEALDSIQRSETDSLSSFSDDREVESKDVNSLSVSQISTLSRPLQFLNSPITNFLGDPIYRATFSGDDVPFRALDAIKVLKATIPFLTSEDATKRTDAYNALNILRNYLVNNGDVETAGRGTSQIEYNERTSLVRKNIPPLNESKIDALLRLFATFSDDSLLNAIKRLQGYDATENKGTVQLIRVMEGSK